MIYNFDIEVYEKFKNIKYLSLDNLYDGDINTIAALDYNLSNVIEYEAPITLNLIKERMREVFGVKKISGKALDIILDRLNRFNYATTDNLYDIVYWPKCGIYDINCLRESDRQIYDICYQELKPLVLDLKNKGYNGEELYREILKFFGLSVLTEKVRNYLEFISNKY